MKVAVHSMRRGLIIKVGRRTYAVDCVSGYKCDAHVITHAHADHLPKSLCGLPVSSKETAALAAVRGLRYEPREVEGVELVDSGHILGSRATLIEGEVLCTGDFCPRDRAFLKGFRPPRARVLVIEATYGRRQYVFEDFASIYERALRDIAAALVSGRPAAAVGYPLGKAQELEYLFKQFDLLVHRGLEKYREVYRKAGVQLAEEARVIKSLREVEAGKLAIVPSYVRESDIEAARKAGCFIAEFTGWAASEWYRKSTSADAAYPLSDHADFRELLGVVKKVSPETVFITHGFAEDFARVLRREGYDAVPLRPGQTALTEFF